MTHGRSQDPRRFADRSWPHSTLHTPHSTLHTPHSTRQRPCVSPIFFASRGAEPNFVAIPRACDPGIALTVSDAHWPRRLAFSSHDAAAATAPLRSISQSVRPDPPPVFPRYDESALRTTRWPSRHPRRATRRRWPHVRRHRRVTDALVRRPRP